MNIAVVGYPRSGNTWVSRTLGDILDSPVGGAFNAKPLCTEGTGRTGGHYVMQLHLRPTNNTSASRPAWEISASSYTGDPKIVMVVRDPRDVAVSVQHYWNIATIGAALHAVVHGTHVLGGHGPWHEWYEGWLACPIPFVLTRYEDLHSYGDAEWHRILDDLNHLSHLFNETLEYDAKRLTLAVERQEFHNKRRQVERDGNSRPYGKTTQLKHLYRGEVGRWKKEMNQRQQEIAREQFGATARKFGYEL